MQGPRIIILTAIRMETDAIARQFNLPSPKKAQPLSFSHNQYSIHLHTIGVGAIRLPDPLAPLPAAIIMAGLAGALDPSLAIGDVIIDESSTWPPHPLHFPRRKIHTSTTLIATAAAKSALFAQTGAAAVEMEHSSVMEFAKRTQTPFLFIRAISDRADHPINPAVLNFVDPFGQIKPGALIAGLARRPRLVAELRRLSRDSNLALASLAKAVKFILSRDDAQAASN